MRKIDWQKDKKGGFYRLKKLVETGGSADLPTRYVTKDGFNLGGWVHNQRQAYRRGVLSKERQEALEEIEGWAWNSRHSIWEERFQLLQDFALRKGHAYVPRSLVTGNGCKLGSWVTEQRKMYRVGKLSRKRIERLETVPGWTWNVREENNKMWRERLELLKQYTQKHGHPIVPRSYITEDGVKLGRWVGMQRDCYRQGMLSPARIAALESLPGWVWVVRKRRKLT